MNRFHVAKGFEASFEQVSLSRDSYLRAIEFARASGAHRFKGPADTANGTPRHWDVQISPIVGDNGEPRHLLSIPRDIADEWKADTMAVVTPEPSDFGFGSSRLLQLV